MPKVRFSFYISGRVHQDVEVPQAVIDEFQRQVDGGDPDGEAIDQMLQEYVRWDDILDQLDDAEDIELSTIKTEASALLE